MEKRIWWCAVMVGAAAIGGCSPTVPPELADARAAYERVSNGAPAQEAPADVHKAAQALQAAETAFADDPDSTEASDFAYVALRRAELAEVRTSQTIAERDKTKAEQQLMRLQAQAMDRAKDMSDEMRREREARMAAENEAEDLQSKLARIGETKEEARGTVLTLSGSVVFASNKSTLLPGAREKLDQVADALKESPAAKLVVEGHTDSRGSDWLNRELSRERAACATGRSRWKSASARGRRPPTTRAWRAGWPR